jgi:hypothetical protein
MENGTTQLGEYLVTLGEDQDELTKFLKNPERAMRNAGVPAEQRDVILRGDIQEVQLLLREQLGDAPMAFIVHVNWPIIVHE